MVGERQQHMLAARQKDVRRTSGNYGITIPVNTSIIKVVQILGFFREGIVLMIIIVIIIIDFVRHKKNEESNARIHNEHENSFFPT